MSAKMDMQELLKQFLAAQNNGGTVTLPVATEPAAPAAPVPTPELTAVTAELAIAPAPTTVVEPAPAKANGNGKREWQSCDVELADGEKLHLRVAPKGYGCFGFESRGDYACVYGYQQRMEKLAAAFGDGFRKLVMERLIAMGLRHYPNGKD